jgi:hypothetical protein
VFRWDPTQQCYFLHWFDSMGFPPNDFRGQFEGDVLTLVFQGSMGHHRAIFDLREPDRYAFRMDVSSDGNQWFPFMEVPAMRKEK